MKIAILMFCLLSSFGHVARADTFESCMTACNDCKDDQCALQCISDCNKRFPEGSPLQSALFPLDSEPTTCQPGESKKERGAPPCFCEDDGKWHCAVR